MSDVINSIFGRPKNESTGTGEYAYGTVTPEPEVAEAPEVPATETGAPVTWNAARSEALGQLTGC